MENLQPRIKDTANENSPLKKEGYKESLRILHLKSIPGDPN